MKTIKKLSIAVLGFLLLVCIAGFLSITIFASNSVFAEENTSAASQTPESNVIGTATLTPEGIFISSNKASFTLPSYDLYRIYDNNHYRYMAADTLKDVSAESTVVSVAIFTNDNINNMNIIYSDKDEELLYSIHIPNLSDEIYSLWDDTAALLHLGSDEVSSRILQSQRIYTSYLNNTTNYTPQIAPMSQVDITENKYDSYTNSDGIIHNYISSYWGDYEKNNLISDDPIVRIIPKSLCFELGEHLYIGKEYGFFISTTTDYLFSSDKCVDVFVFDISYTNPTFNNAKGSVKVTPLFQRRYRAKERSSDPYWNNSYDNSLSQVVFPHLHYDSPNYYLKDVSFKHTLFNQNAVNKNESGYSASNDNGSFFNTTQYSAVGTAKSTSANPVIDTINFALGYVPYLGDALNVASYVDSMTTKTSYSVKSVNTGDYEVLHQTRKAQLDYYGQLLKTVKISATSADTANPTLIGTKVSGNYAQSTYSVTNGGDDGGIGTTIYHSIKASIADDQTYYIIFNWWPQGDVVTVASANSPAYKGADFAYNPQSISLNTPKSGQIVKAGGAEYFMFKPTVNIMYAIETTGSSDTYMYLYNSSGSQISLNDDSGEGRNAKITYRLEANKIYYIKIRLYSSSAVGAFNLKITYSSSGTLTYNTSKSVTLNSGQNMLYTFVPTETKSYNLQTTGSLDTYLYLLDTNFNQLTYNDDGGDSTNAKITYTLEAGKTYYIRVRLYSSSKSGTFNILIN